MIATGSLLHRFNLLHLEENEHYIKDFQASVRYFDVNYNNYKSAKATVHFCSRSLLVELVTDQQAPIYKLLFKYMAKEPLLRNTSNTLPLHVEVTRIITVPVNHSAP
mgnify:CR=1 FL=1